MGEGFAGISRAGASGFEGLHEVADQIAQNLEDIVDASQLTDFAAFKAAMASIEMLQKSNDSRI
jgi:hypothetical protein